jgi:hypothetical protein
VAIVWRYWLDHKGRRYELPRGTTLLGRSEHCQILIEDALVSRQHARIVVGEGVRVEDVGSSNGVSVNGVRVQGAELVDGDTLGIGNQRLVVRREEVRLRRRAQTMTETMHGTPAGETPGSASSTLRREPLELLSPVIDKALALGHGAEAVRLLEPHLQRHLEAARATGRATPHTERAVTYAVRLAEITRLPRWVDYCFELYAVLGVPLPAATIELLYSALRNVRGVSVARFRGYVELLEAKTGLKPRERFLVQRISGLAKLVQ